MRHRWKLLFAVALAAGSAGAGAEPANRAQFEAAVARTKKAMMGDPRAALASAQEAVAVARALPPSPATVVDAAVAQWLHGEALIYMNNVAGAAPLIDGALATVERVAPDTKLHGDLLRSHGAVAAMTGRLQQALRDYQRAHDVFRRAGEARSQAIALQDIGQIYCDAGDYDRTLEYYEKSAEVFSGDPVLTLTMQNNRAEVFRKQKRYPEAAAAYRAALVQAKKLGSPMLQVRILSNLGGSEAESGRLASADAAVAQAMALTGHGEAAGWRPFVFGTAGRIAAARGDAARAARLLQPTFEGVDLAKTDLVYREYHRTAAEVFEKLGDIRLALAHAKAFQRLEGEAQQLVASNAAQLMAARFDFANQAVQISKLKQDRLARDVAAERERGRTRNLLFAGLFIAGAFVFGVLLFAFFAARRSRDAVRAAYSSLSDANAELEKALQAKTEFLATTSHEIRTPLNGILGMTQVLLADRAVDGRTRERIEVVHGAGETMKALVDDILDVAKMESGELSVAQEPTELRAILDDAARLWSGHAQAKGLELALDTADCPRRIVGDGPRLRQIVFNLMSNALKFTAQGRVSLFAGTRSDEAGERLVIRVSDTGIGIPLDKQAEIFDAFKQVDGGVTRQFGGTGLGLAICRRLAVAMGGDVVVESLPGQGSTFTIALPLELADPAQPEPGSAEPQGEGAMAGARVLVVDPDPANRGLLCLLLAGEDADVSIGADAAAAVRALEAGEASHVLLDADGESANGLRDAARAAAASGARLTLMLRPDTAGVTVAEAMAAGASQIVVKPLAAAELLAALRSLYGDDPEPFVAPSLLGRAA